MGRYLRQSGFTAAAAANSIGAYHRGHDKRLHKRTPLITGQQHSDDYSNQKDCASTQSESLKMCILYPGREASPTYGDLYPDQCMGVHLGYPSQTRQWGTGGASQSFIPA
ncbi:hypothetical protein COCSUDRAFT_31989 [Coccomyxa subellipsoidea C-169]|uniref:Uncharacterized protein n=1 Tax=Coccomyxa subellipsoidea (strain C-169) TaxID=574566 RepID=I0Z9Q0_COCSC|nr:hypothetical protein COCSUDRAFT_31989 [Coccomyxa subellipsoidea C-169]EIE27369.1 hypothetical protein COCSUDRAFT_31989 [Coccomyxa subellipsoidea C-169]|eukprot:XP_005651913.1 hypothetical protein COCSUDRAFT_31989 [Coccomyxa subellipsoidea C-169]